MADFKKLPREELADAIRQLHDDLRFRVFVRRLAATKESVLEQCMAAPTAELAEPLRLEARAYNNLLKDLRKNGAPDETSSSAAPG